MKFHYVTENNMVVSDLKFGASLKPLIATPPTQRPNYVTISISEFEEANMQEKQMIIYINRLRGALNFGGQIFLEVPNQTGK